MRNSYRILVVDDEPYIAEMCRDMLLALGYKVIGMAGSYNKAIGLIDSKNPDLVILDISLEEEKDGTDLGTYIGTKSGMEHIYLTSHKDVTTINRAAQTSPAAYLIKPFDQDDLFATIEVIRSRKRENMTIKVSSGHTTLNISLDDLIYIKSDNIYLELYVDKKKHLVRSSLEKFLDQHNYPNFIRVHRSYAINMLKVDSFNGQYVMLGEVKCPISRSYKQELLQRFSS
ncbi:MAG: response regulator transcription factor [Bacteroidota bacterium]